MLSGFHFDFFYLSCSTDCQANRSPALSGHGATHPGPLASQSLSQQNGSQLSCRLLHFIVLHLTARVTSQQTWGSRRGRKQQCLNISGANAAAFSKAFSRSFKHSCQMPNYLTTLDCTVIVLMEIHKILHLHLFWCSNPPSALTLHSLNVKIICLVGLLLDLSWLEVHSVCTVTGQMKTY